ncbi:sulfur carrier protein ThiS [Donghicola sp. XS_ASV15]|uniref:sulfur carrier protein ThiS n=1 Tax=Donghicola sp. XS_ASV15 TaxID=3241295 RepID=UPI00351374D9
MQIELNGKPFETDAATLADLIDVEGFEAPSVATAVDGIFVPRATRASVSLTEGLRIEVLSPMQGG